MKPRPPSGKRRRGKAVAASEHGASHKAGASAIASGATEHGGLAGTEPSPKGVASPATGAREGVEGLAASPPRATYRLQFQKDFTFDDAAAIAPYLARLGISHVYASPIHKARPGSMHGYDVVDHAAINPELGGEEGFLRFSDVLRKHGLGLVLDIVPNHVGIGAENEWWQSVLEWGELSGHARAFDIDWERLGANHKLVVPFLGNRYGVALEKGELVLSFDESEGSFGVAHFDQRFPLCPLSYPIILDRALAALEETAPPADILTISERLRLMGEETLPDGAPPSPTTRRLKQELARAVAASAPVGQAIERAVSLINGTIGVPESFGTLHRLLEAQSYRLAHWRVAASDINYRRFFESTTSRGFASRSRRSSRRARHRVQAHPRRARRRLEDRSCRRPRRPRKLSSRAAKRRRAGLFIVVEKILEPMKISSAGRSPGPPVTMS